MSLSKFFGFRFAQTIGLVAALSAASVPNQQAFAMNAGNDSARRAAATLNALHTPAMLLKALRASGNSAAATLADEMETTLTSRHVDLNQALPTLKAQANRIQLENGQTIAIVKSSRPLILSVSGRAWSYDPMKSFTKNFDGFEKEFSAPSSQGALGRFLLPEARADGPVSGFLLPVYVTLVGYFYLTTNAGLLAAMLSGLIATGVGVVGLVALVLLWSVGSRAEDQPLIPAGLSCPDIVGGKPSGPVKMDFSQPPHTSLSVDYADGNPSRITVSSEGKSMSYAITRDKKGNFQIVDKDGTLKSALKSKNASQESLAKSTQLLVSGMDTFLQTCQNPEELARLNAQLAKMAERAAAAKAGNHNDVTSPSGTDTTSTPVENRTDADSAK